MTGSIMFLFRKVNIRTETTTATRLIRIALVNAKCLGSETLNLIVQIYNQHL